jgi:ribosome maturation factor RimP
MLETRLQALLTPVVEGLGYELVLIEFQGAGRSATLRLFIDSPGGIIVADCERVSREVAALLDVEDPIPSAYQLEVSSPGLDRPLVTPAHYQRFLGEQVRVQLVAPRDNRRKWLGVLLSADDDGIELMAAEGRVTLSYSEIERARLVPDFDRELAKS